ncbi:MAG: hypothetical protein CR984_03580, partial [Proteobacteria bacterium]
MSVGSQANRITSTLFEAFANRAPINAEAVEAHLDEQLAGIDLPDRISVLESILQKKNDSCRPAARGDNDEAILTKVCSLLLGRPVSIDDLNSSELLEKLAESLNTIFNSLNQLISVINITLSGEESSEQTIRQVISFRLAGEGQGRSLETYLGQISNAFLTSQQSFK